MGINRALRCGSVYIHVQLLLQDYIVYYSTNEGGVVTEILNNRELTISSDSVIIISGGRPGIAHYVLIFRMNP